MTRIQCDMLQLDATRSCMNSVNGSKVHLSNSTPLSSIKLTGEKFSEEAILARLVQLKAEVALLARMEVLEKPMQPRIQAATSSSPSSTHGEHETDVTLAPELREEFTNAKRPNSLWSERLASPLPSRKRPRQQPAVQADESNPDCPNWAAVALLNLFPQASQHEQQPPLLPQDENVLQRKASA